MFSEFGRRRFLRTSATLGATLGASGFLSGLPSVVRAEQDEVGVPVDSLPKLEGELTLYLGRGEGGLYEKVISAIEDRNPDLKLNIRRGPTAALANTIVAEAKAGVMRADVFWAVDSGAIGLVSETGKAQPLPDSITSQVDERFRFENWVPISGRIRTLPYHTGKLSADEIPTSIMAIAEGDLELGWAPAYGAFQSFITAMRLLEGDDATKSWLQAGKKRATSYAGELGAVMAAARGEVDVAFANHYYTLRLKSGDPDAAVALAFSENDAGCLLNASGAMALREGELARNFIRYLLTREVQSFLSSEAYEIPMITGASTPEGLPELSEIHPPEVKLSQLADLEPTLRLMREAGVL